jgi:CRP/FNR family transcriptional regulator, nitrogen fixation regulation protein
MGRHGGHISLPRLDVVAVNPTHLERSDRFGKPQSTLTRQLPIRCGTSGANFVHLTLMRELAVVATPVSFARDSEIYSEGEPTTYAYKVVSGAVRTCKLLSNGRRQIAGFQLPSDIFGLELRPEQSLSAEAVNDTTVLIFRHDAVIELAERDRDSARELWLLTARQLQRVQNHALLLAKNAKERVAAFLLDMATRMPSGNVINLPMSRQDIADYLGLTIETVSRTLTQLENDGTIELSTSRQIVLRDQCTLNELNGLAA